MRGNGRERKIFIPCVVWLVGKNARKWFRLGLDCVFGVWRLRFSFFFCLRAFVRLQLLFMYCLMNSSCKVWHFYFFQPISAHSNPQISFFSNFLIKNGSHGTIYTFKNYFATVFFNFQFQFSVFSCIQTDSYAMDQFLIKIKIFCFTLSQF